MINGVLLEAPKVIPHPLGDIARAMKSCDQGFHGFGEVYFTSVHKGKVKGWKKHQRMYLNLVVIVGSVRFVLHDDRPDSESFQKIWEVVLSRENNYRRLTVPPGVWVGFQGLGDDNNIILNIASIEHDPSEADNRDLKEIPYEWSP
jgi:dTDP-4-dehydrorhamnose 3,5-epimerase